MELKLHAALQALFALYYSSEISEEEWALLQIHMAYCDECHEKFRVLSRVSACNSTHISPMFISSHS